MSRVKSELALPVLIGLAVLHALPALLSAVDLQSDAAVVGLQARHLLHGEWSWFLWGSGYQTATDSVLAAMLFAVLGATPLALTLGPFLGHLLLVALVYGTLRRRFEPWSSALLTSPLVAVTGPLHIYIFSPPRQAALTLVFLAIWLLDGAAHRRRPCLGLAGGGLVAGLSCLADPYALLFLPGVGLFLVLHAFEVTPGERLKRLAAGLLGGCAGLVPAWLLRHSEHAASGVFGLTSGVVAHNLGLLWQTCLPYLLGTTVYYSPRMPVMEVWPAPTWFRVLQLAGAGLLLAGISLGGVCIGVRRIPFSIRRLAALGAVMLPLTLVAFALSVMVMDRYSARYLAAIVLMAPFALAPALSLLGAPRFALLLTPWLVSAAVAGWLGYGGEVDGWKIVPHPENASDEQLLAELLRQHGLDYGVADYWVSYRLTFLYREHPIIVPWHEQLDRYPPYRAAMAAQARVAYIYDPWRSIEDFSTRSAAIAAGETEFSRTTETLRAGRYTVLVLERSRATRASLTFNY